MIFPFFKKKKEEKINAPSLNVDLHSHLIPGIDDGSKSMQESLELLKGMRALGYKKVITTPHIMADVYCNTPKIIQKGLSDLRQATLDANIDIEIDVAAEYYLDDGFSNLLKKGDLMTINEEYLLFETSYYAKPMQIEEMIFEIFTTGYKPIMAHPERYRYVKDYLVEYKRFKELGIFFQVNLNSFGGHYGRDAKQKAVFLSKEGMIDFLGSDVHHEKQLSTLKDVFLLDIYKEIFDKNIILNDKLL